MLNVKVSRVCLNDYSDGKLQISWGRGFHILNYWDEKGIVIIYISSSK